MSEALSILEHLELPTKFTTKFTTKFLFFVGLGPSNFEGPRKRFTGLLARYLKPDLLIIDDMGLKTLPARSGELLLEIILRRHEVRSTIMTSNRPVDEWGKLLGDVPAAGAILDRLLHRAEVIAINGRSHRLAASVADQAPGGQSAAERTAGRRQPDICGS